VISAKPCLTPEPSPQPSPGPALRLTIDGEVLAENWRRLGARGGTAACGAVVKADGYGLGSREVVDRLARVGCRSFFVSTWNELERLGPLGSGLGVSVLHGVRPEDMPLALAGIARPVLCSLSQVARWKAAGGGLCDVMIDTGINRLGLRPEEIDSLAGLEIDTLLTHLACADDPDHPLNEVQLSAFKAAATRVPARRLSAANSAGVYLGRRFCFDLTRPGLALYGGAPNDRADDLGPVAHVEAQVMQVRRVPAGETVGYGGAWTAARDSRVAILNIGYADGFFTAFSNRGRAKVGQAWAPVIGRVSMDLAAIDATGLDVEEGDWVALDPDLRSASAASGVSQYELLTSLGRRFERRWK
jgi:alanine racemase